MAMTQEEFDQTVSRMEKAWDKNPSMYKFRLILFALLGYVYIGLVAIIALGSIGLLCLLALSGKLLTIFFKAFIKIGIPILIFIYTIFRSLWVKIEPPTGIPLKHEQAPSLFKLINQYRKEIKGPRIHKVLVYEEFNACVSQVPRLGLFGWYKNYLVIGMPLMLALSPEEFNGVLAHELGHVSRYHGRTGAWIYRIRQTWVQLNENFHRDKHWGSFIFAKFFDWFAPRFWAYSFVPTRVGEYEADQLSALLVGKEKAS